MRPLTLKELEHIYPIRALLDPEALRLTGLPWQERLARLEALNRKLVDAQEAEHVVSHDDEWHRVILAGCPNPVLVELIEQFIRRTRRYELALMRERRNVLRTVQDHERILAALRVGDLDGACAALRKNMESGKEAIVAWLRDRSTE